MKLNKVHHGKFQYQKSEQEINIFKKISSQQQKRQFFKHVSQQIENNFSQKILQILLNDIQSAIHRNKKINSTENCNPIKSLHVSTLSSTIEYTKKNNDLLIFQKIDTNALRENIKKTHISQLPIDKTMDRKYLKTPKQKSAYANIIPKKLLNIDKKMRKNYQKTRQRLIFNNKQESFLATCVSPSSFSLDRSKTYHVERYNTQVQQIEPPTGQQSVPERLLRVCFVKKTKIKLSQSTYNKKRMQSLLNNPSTSLQKLKKIKIAH